MRKDMVTNMQTCRHMSAHVKISLINALYVPCRKKRSLAISRIIYKTIHRKFKQGQIILAFIVFQAGVCGIAHVVLLFHVYVYVDVLN